MLDFLNLVNVQNLQVIIVSNLIAFVLGLIIFFFYKYTNKGVSYDSTFGFTLILITIIVSSIMVTIRSNIALSLGLIGSLSIIRFRTAIKSSVDMAFLLWCIAAGLAVGSPNYPVAIGSTIALGFVVLVLNKVGLFFKTNKDYIMILQLNSLDDKDRITKILNNNLHKWQLKSSFSNKESSEITYSIFSKKNQDIDKLTSTLKNINSVKQVSLLAPETNLFI